MRLNVGLLSICLLLSGLLKGQDTLPGFSATMRGPGKVLISWHNNYPVVTQISIQRSADSLKYFTTLLTVPDPALPENGAVDSRSPLAGWFYRLFIVFDNGRYLFTPSRRAQAEPTAAVRKIVEKEDDAAGKMLAKAADSRIVFVDPVRDHERAVIKSPTSIHGAPPHFGPGLIDHDVRSQRLKGDRQDLRQANPRVPRLSHQPDQGHPHLYRRRYPAHQTLCCARSIPGLRLRVYGQIW